MYIFYRLFKLNKCKDLIRCYIHNDAGNKWGEQNKRFKKIFLTPLFPPGSTSLI